MVYTITYFSKKRIITKMTPSQQAWSQSMQPLQISYRKACQMLDVSRDTLRVLMLRDPEFPRAIKLGNTRQSPVFFSHSELVEWHNKRKAQS